MSVHRELNRVMDLTPGEKWESNVLGKKNVWGMFKKSCGEKSCHDHTSLEARGK